MPLPRLSFKPVRMRAFDFSNQTSVRNINCRLNRSALIKSICYDFCLFSFAVAEAAATKRRTLAKRARETDADHARVLAAMFV